MLDNAVDVTYGELAVLLTFVYGSEGIVLVCCTFRFDEVPRVMVSSPIEQLIVNDHT